MRTGWSSRTALAALPTALLAGGLVVLGAAPAAAASGITSPGDGAVVAEHAVVPLRAVVDGPALRPSELSLLAPGAEVAEVVAVQTSPDGGELAYDLDTRCAAAVCSGRAPAANGTWTVRLTGAASDEAVFVLRIPPAVPEQVAAAPSEAGVVVRWRLGDEPDLTRYAVERPGGAVLRDDIGPDACDAERTCRVELPDDSGTWVVRAYRAVCPGCTDELASVASEPATLGAAAPGDALPGGVAAPGGSLPGAASPAPAAGRSGPDQRTAFARAFGSGSGRAAAAAPPSQVGPPAALPALPDGTFDPALGYAPVVPGQAGAAPLDRASDALGEAVGGSRLPLLVASGLLIGAAVWMRRWARRVIAD